MLELPRPDAGGEISSEGVNSVAEYRVLLACRSGAASLT
jgi:hypothetical protein